MTAPAFPTVRMRRLRKTEALRSLVRENRVETNDLIYPLFVEEEIETKVPISSMPGLFRIPEIKLAQEVKQIYAEGIKSIMLFGVSHKKDASGSDSWSPDGLLSRMVKRAKDAAPDLVIIPDICFCEYTDHGHCGVIDSKNGHVHNDMTLNNLAQQAVNAANAGADIIAPSAMMDGQIAALRQALDEAGHTDIPLMSYSSKFASGFYGPFRAAAGCDLKGDRKTYQMDPLNGREALLPLAVYQVSGEYAMIKFASAAGALDEKRVVRETLGAFKRAGADLIITYFARDIAREGF